MSWFSEQLRDRRDNDNDSFDNSLRNISDAIIGNGVTKSDSDTEIASNTIDEILKYYKYRVKENRELADATFEKKLAFTCSQLGINYRSVDLDPQWYKDAIGPMIGELKDGTKVALIPDIFGRYSFIDYKTGNKYRVNAKTNKLLKNVAILFYNPLPLKELSIKDLFIYMLKQINGADIAIYFIMLGLITALGFLTPMFTKWLFQDVIKNESIQLLISLAIFMLGYTLCSFLFQSTQELINDRINTKIDTAVEAAVMNRIINLPARFFKDYSSGELSAKSSYVQALCDSLISAVAGTGITSVFSLVYLFQVSVYAPSLVVPSLIITLSTIVISTITTFVQMNISKKSMELGSKLSGLTYSTITGIQKIKLTGCEKRMFSRWGNAYAESAKVNYNPPAFIKLNGAITAAVSAIGTLVLYYLASTNNVQVADYYAFNASYSMISGAFVSLTGIITTVANIKPILDMSKPILEAVPEVSEGKRIITDFTGFIEINNLSFKYQPELPLVIDNLSLRIKKGEYLAIVGSTGCGKSTLVRLLLGFEKPTSGSIFFDRYDISKIDLKSLRKNIGTVMQDSKLFTGDIYSNITITAPHLSIDEAMEVAKIACIDKDIEDMPMGMHTLISEGQGGVSGGQKQRLIIARALANKPKVLIFDEATSALDNITQKKITEAIDKLNCTRIVIAHRLSTIKNADRILYLDKGRIAEEGTYDELIAKNGLFAQLVERQRLDKGN